MDYTHKSHKATYLVQRFIGSEDFYLFNLRSYEIAILYTIARYLDMPAHKCFAKQSLLAAEAGMGLTQFKASLKILVQKKLILTYSSWRNNGYELGEYFEYYD